MKIKNFFKPLLKELDWRISGIKVVRVPKSELKKLDTKFKKERTKKIIWI